ncbi:MAG: PilZ domain-containing protein [Chloroflexi bacterium]|nr:PilZ domain-containing protein [Chloroflexota bacterium]
MVRGLLAGIDTMRSWLEGSLFDGNGGPYWEDPEGQRRFERIALHRASALLYPEGQRGRQPVAAEAVDISVGGARLLSPAVVETGSSLTIVIPLPTGRTLAGLNARVVWVRRQFDTTLIGIEFIELRRADRLCIEDAVLAFGHHSKPAEHRLSRGEVAGCAPAAAAEVWSGTDRSVR